MNPLDQPGTVFKFGARNPNPSSSRTKAGPVYRVSLELEKDDWEMFMLARDSGLVLAIHAAVVPDTGAEPSLELEPEPEPEPKPVKGPYGKEAQALHRRGFFQANEVGRALSLIGFESMTVEDKKELTTTKIKQLFQVDSMTKIRPAQLGGWALSKRLEHLMPHEFIAAYHREKERS